MRDDVDRFAPAGIPRSRQAAWLRFPSEAELMLMLTRAPVFLGAAGAGSDADR
jgi:hypothetical protein